VALLSEAELDVEEPTLLTIVPGAAVANPISGDTVGTKTLSGRIDGFASYADADPWWSYPHRVALLKSKVAA
jgi:hypothetical protein